MSIEEVLISKHFVFKSTTKWVAINDTRPAFENAFGTKRFGKLCGTRLHITLGVVKHECERLIGNSGLTLHRLSSSDGSGRVYPGFDTGGLPTAAPEEIVGKLCAAVDQQRQTSRRPVAD
ncbi:hypothetical protein [Massilia sp. H6]|uniref:hypothetical protein n=1 Tax=Massilia sp. H6 TaxID=2970464 RepID=UPI0021685BDA|nr:hypothetical protein [Massilia sp. H6]UVW30717.1 hypothetical protein NRS07_19975 [Massilia sp. H6]